ncbi:MAG: tRNA uridine-5-carboxymethylaminomethyl(34) synthesis GTPase MnmE [Gammaproteobacteria bacterium]
MNLPVTDTIAAQATPPGRGGVGIIRVSGPMVCTIAQAILGRIPKPRYADYAHFRDRQNDVLDEGIALFFPAPHSFTGEDVLELHGHGGAIIMDCLLQQVLQLGARLARPGEFSERAFLNGKLDLAQVEAIADLIDATSVQAARLAMRSLQGEFSQCIHQLVEKLIHLRMYVEAAINFPEEEIDFLSDGKIAKAFAEILTLLEQTQCSAQQGVLLREGLHVVIAGQPNAGKSSLLNCLSGYEAAIVTDVPGTTRDVLREQIQIDGVPLHVFDTAGLRPSGDIVEQEGMRRARSEISKADHVLWVVDATLASPVEENVTWREFTTQLPIAAEKITVIQNKIDLLPETPRQWDYENHTVIALSLKTGAGVDLLRTHLRNHLGLASTTEGHFLARRRHLQALQTAHQHLTIGWEQFITQRAGELLAEELHLAQETLAEITGEFRSDDLLGKIFSSFCIGK